MRRKQREPVPPQFHAESDGLSRRLEKLADWCEPRRLLFLNSNRPIHPETARVLNINGIR
jgi:hypothetical protein